MKHPFKITQVLAMIVDYKSPEDAERLSVQLAKIQKFSRQFTKTTHSALQNETLQYYDLKIVHIDNGNFPPVQRSQEQEAHSIEVLATGKNRGYAGALNYAIRHYQDQPHHFDAFWLLNSDLEIDPHCLDHLVKTLTDQPQVGAVGPLVYIFNKEREPRSEGRGFAHLDKVWGARGKVSPLLGLTAMTDWKQGGVLPKWSYLPGCTVLIRASAYQAAGGLPERYQLYFEETEFCIHLQRLDWELWVSRNAIAYHKVDSLKAGIPARHFAYYFIRNNLLFWKTSFGIPLWLQFPRMLYVAGREVLLPLRRARNASDVWDRLKYLGAGIIDGVLLALNRPLRFEKKLFSGLPPK